MTIFDNVLHAKLYKVVNKGLVDYVVCAHCNNALSLLLGAVRRDDYYGDFLHLGGGMKHAQKFAAVHYGHHKVKENCVNLTLKLLQLFKCVLAVRLVYVARGGCLINYFKFYSTKIFGVALITLPHLLHVNS